MPYILKTGLPNDVAPYVMKWDNVHNSGVRRWTRSEAEAQRFNRSEAEKIKKVYSIFKMEIIHVKDLKLEVNPAKRAICITD
jgi:hypothetical protein